MTQESNSRRHNLQRLQPAEWETVCYYWEWLRNQMLQASARLLDSEQAHERALGKLYRQTAEAMLDCKTVINYEVACQYPGMTRYEIWNLQR